MTFSAPLALLLLLIIPAIVYVGRPRVAFRRGRDIASLIIRTLILLLLILALAGAQSIQAADKLAVVFLVDASDSVAAQDAQVAYMRDAIAAMRPEDEAAIVVFGANALVERPMSSVREVAPIRSTPITGNTDLQEAISLGLALFPSDAAKRMVILSDGLQTVGDAEVAARRAASTDVEISYVEYEREFGAEVLVSDVRVPAAVGAGQQFDLSLTVRAEQDTRATITVFAAGAIIHRDDVTLRAGDNHYALTLQAGETDYYDFRVQVDPVSGDVFYQNNGLAAFSRVIGAPRVMVVSPSADEADALIAALTELGLLVDLVDLSDMPVGVAGLTAYSAVILNNVPATQLSNRRMETLQTYVRDLGGGLIAIGGPNAYAPGGYFETPLEETLPVEMQIRDQQRLPQLTIAYVIDRSGSMSMIGPSGVENIELAKEAIIRSLNFLQPNDRAGVISFDTDGYWIAEMQPVLDRVGLQLLVGSLRAGGGTDILAGMTLAAQAMQTEPSERKHIILLTDGGANEAGLVRLTQELYETYDVTTSVIAIGGMAADFLDDMAQAGGGNYHQATQIETIPSIFAQETVLATRSYIFEEEFVPTIGAIHPIIDGIGASPSLLGYVATTPKDTAQVILRGSEPFSDPILAAWQYGLGRAVAFTSDATGRWAANWIGWEGFARFWNQAVRWTITEGASDNLEARIVMEGETARLIVDARDDDRNFRNGLTLTTSLVSPDREAVVLRLQQVAPGRYEATFTPSAEGAYFLRIGDADGAVDLLTGWVMSYSPEYNTRADARSILPDLAEMTGGQNLSDDSGAAFAHKPAVPTTSPLAPQLLLAALLLLPIDIAVRRLLITRGDLKRAWAALRPPRQTPQTSDRLSTLIMAKARAQEKTQGAPPPTPRTGGEGRSAPSAPRSPRPADQPEQDGSLAGKLLQKRKERER